MLFWNSEIYTCYLMANLQSSELNTNKKQMITIAFIFYEIKCYVIVSVNVI
jgi:hypothetical protein